VGHTQAVALSLSCRDLLEGSQISGGRIMKRRNTHLGGYVVLGHALPGQSVKAGACIATILEVVHVRILRT
jgi:hypothetical protein